MSMKSRADESAHMKELANRLSPDASPVSKLLVDVASLLDAGADLKSRLKPRRGDVMEVGREALRVLAIIEEFADRAPSQDINNPETLCGRLAENVLAVLDYCLARAEAIGSLSDFSAVVSA